MAVLGPPDIGGAPLLPAPLPSPLAPRPQAPAPAQAPSAVVPPGLNVIGNGPMQDPQFLAWYRQNGATEAEAYAAAVAKQSALDRALQVQLPEYRLALQKNLRDIGNSYLDKGTFQSGQRLLDQALAQEDTQNQVNKLVQDTATQKIDTTNTLVSALAKSKEAAAEQGLSARGNVALGSAAANTASTSNAPTVGSSRVAGSSNLTGV